MDAVKTLGSFNAEVRLMEGVVAKILVTVESL
jgi:ribosomal protein L9